jgi:hypothetical protein
MSYRSIFDAKIPTVDAYLVFDFSADLVPGEIITSAVTSGLVYSGAETLPPSLSAGGYTVSGGQVTQVAQGGLAGVSYNLTCVAQTSSSRSLVREGYLVVRDRGT